MLIGYVRVSTNDQNTELQRNALECAGCERIFEDKISGTKSDRPGLKKLLRTLSAGDTLVVWKLDRLGRSMRHLVTLIEELPEITGGRLSLLALEQMAEQGKAWPLIEGSGTIYGMYVIEGLNQTKTEFFRDGMPRRIEFTLSLKRVDESLSDMFGDLSAQLNNLQDTATSALSDISKTVGGLLS